MLEHLGKLSHTRRTRYTGGTFFPDSVPTSAQLIFGGHRQCIFQGIPAVNFTSSCKTTAFFFFTGAIKSYRKHISRAGRTLLVSLPKERRDHDVSETLKRSFRVVGSLVTGTRGPRLRTWSILWCLTRRLFFSPAALHLLIHAAAPPLCMLGFFFRLMSFCSWVFHLWFRVRFVTPT